VPRSVAELLPRQRPFSELTLDDVAKIIENQGDERETLFFERKATLNGNALAKACAAFANTYGGLLVGGVADKEDALVGMEPFGASEAQLFVKDTLRGLVLPMPPFRARWLPTEADRGLLLVLVEESSTTPHLLTRSGAIYVRSPGSSDPVPLTDQRTLLELWARGEKARAAAVDRAGIAQELVLDDEAFAIEGLSLAATGVSTVFEERLFAPATPDYIGTTAWGDSASPKVERRDPMWAPAHVGVYRRRASEMPTARDVLLSGATVTREGATFMYHGFTKSHEIVTDIHSSLTESKLRERFSEAFEAAREILLELGAHGDLYLVYRLTPNGRDVVFDSRPDVPSRTLNGSHSTLWTTLDAAPPLERIFAEVARAAGLGPLDELNAATES
jgi:hypothetical protein